MKERVNINYHVYCKDGKKLLVGKISVYIVPDGKFTKSDEIQFIHAFEELVGVGILDYSNHLVPDIKDLTYTRRGKFKMVINNIIDNKL